MACAPCGSVKDVPTENSGGDTIHVYEEAEDDARTPLLNKQVNEERRNMIFKYNDDHFIVEAKDGPNGTWKIPVPPKDKDPPMKYAKSLATLLVLLWLLLHLRPLSTPLHSPPRVKG